MKRALFPILFPIRIALMLFLQGTGALLLVACGGGSGSIVPKIDSGRASTLISNFAAQTNRSSVAAAVIKQGNLLWSQGTGTANKTLSTKATDDTVYLVASVSKVITAVAAMQLVEAGKLNLDADINTYLPFQIVNPNLPTATITMRHLLTHRSSIVDDYYNTVSYPALYYRDADPNMTLADWSQAMFTTSGSLYNRTSFSTSAPGTQYSYCNVGYALAGYIVEVVSGEPFDSYCRNHIFTPLGMTSTSWRVRDFLTARMAMPYDLDGSALSNYTFADYPDGGMRTTAKDLSRFLRAMILGGSLDGQTILKPASVAEMKRYQFPPVDGAGQGLGWEAGPAGPYSVLIGKAGAERGVSAAMAYNPLTNAGAIILTNKGFDSDADGYAMQSLMVSLIGLAETP